MLESFVTKLLSIPLDFMTGVMGIPFPIAIGINTVIIGTSIVMLFIYVLGNMLF